LRIGHAQATLIDPAPDPARFQGNGMNTRRRAWIAGALGCALLMTRAFAAPSADVHAAMSYDGLERISVKGIDLAYARPGASLAAYEKVIIEPIEVAFRKDWNPKKTGSELKLSSTDRENIRTGVAKIVRDEFVRAIEAKSGYKVVAEPGPDVLRVKAMILNLYVSAPQGRTAARTQTYTVSAGEMTLVAELHDSETGQVLARVVDRQAARSSSHMTFTNSAANTDEARDIASAWARALRDGLDKAHDIGRK